MGIKKICSLKEQYFDFEEESYISVTIQYRFCIKKLAKKKQIKIQMCLLFYLYLDYPLLTSMLNARVSLVVLRAR